MKKQSSITVATRQSLIDAFWELYEKKRIEQIRIREITDLAHYHRGTFYEYFVDIYDLLEQEEEAVINKIVELSPLLQEENVDDVVSQVAAFYEANGRHLTLLIGENGDPNFIYKLKKAVYPRLLQFKKLPDNKEMEIVFEFIINGLVMTFCKWQTDDDELPLKEYMQIIHLLMEQGIVKTLEVISRTEE